MADGPQSDKYRALAARWQSAMRKGEIKVAIRAALDAYRQAEAENQDVEAKAALGRLHFATSEFNFGQSSQGAWSQSCSFCGQSGFDVRLGAGPDVLICADCVSVFYEEVGLRPGKSSKRS